MTDRFAPPPPDSVVDAAVARVLAAEQVAREALVRAEAEAALIAEAARAAQRGLAERTRRRTLRVREAFARDVRARLQRITHEAGELSRHDEPDAADVARMSRAVERLAAELSEPRP